MAGDGLHDLFTVFTFKTPPSGDFVYQREQNDGRAGSPSPPRRARRSRPTNAMFLELRAEPNCRARLDGPLQRDTLQAIPPNNSRGDCRNSRGSFASARAGKALL